jgi:SOS-response transcriptional repressor LexA
MNKNFDLGELMKSLSKRQQDVYNCIEQYHAKNGISPAMTDIAEELGLANSTIATYIENLRKKGRVTSLPGVPRSFKIVPAIACVV